MDHVTRQRDQGADYFQISRQL